MNTKKKIPWAALYMALVIMLVGAYFVSGLFTLPDVTLLNYAEKLTYYRDYHFGQEHGTADWGELSSMQKTLADPNPMRNTVISKNISIEFDALSNMNLLIIGGSGSGKTNTLHGFWC